MIPVRRATVELGDDGSLSIAMNIVGTPYSEVHLSSAVARSVATGSNAGAGMTMHAPCEVAARLPITIPKQ